MINRNQRKRQFINWVINHYIHIDPMVNQFLQFVLNDSQSIQYISFTQESHYTPRGIYISYKNNTTTPFAYYKQQKEFRKCEQAFHDFRLNIQSLKEQFYFEFDLPNIYLVLSQFDIYEENPYLQLDDQLDQVTDHVLNQLAMESQINHWRKLIDDYLENHDYEQVEYYLSLIEKARVNK